MRKIYLLMAVAAVLMVGCKGNANKKAAAEAKAAEEAAAVQAQAVNDAIDARPTKCLRNSQPLSRKSPWNPLRKPSRRTLTMWFLLPLLKQSRHSKVVTPMSSQNG